jgi:hypothetical protein
VEQDILETKINPGDTYATGKPPRPTIIKVKTWCTGGLYGSDTQGAQVTYWLMDPGGGISNKGWRVIEYVSDPTLTYCPQSVCSSYYGPGTSYYDSDGFPDAIGDTNLKAHLNVTQYFKIATWGHPLHTVSIQWFDGAAPIPSHRIDISAANKVSIDNVETGNYPNYCKNQPP